jgi:hypothetical protein
VKNPVYSKVPVIRKFTQSRGATVDLIYILYTYRRNEARRSILYIYYILIEKSVVARITKGPLDLQRGHWYSTVQYSRVEYRTQRSSIYNNIIRLMFGRSGNESFIQQNACKKGIFAIARRNS